MFLHLNDDSTIKQSLAILYGLYVHCLYHTKTSEYCIFAFFFIVICLASILNQIMDLLVSMDLQKEKLSFSTLNHLLLLLFTLLNPSLSYFSLILYDYLYSDPSAQTFSFLNQHLYPTLYSYVPKSLFVNTYSQYASLFRQILQKLMCLFPKHYSIQQYISFTISPR